MVYKKYVYRNGKKFGPYYYESYRDGGKVKTRFISGPKKGDVIKDKIKSKKSFFFLFGVILFIGILFAGIFYLGKISEKVLFEPESKIYGTKCIEYWVCDEWGKCIDGRQTRECQDENGCGSEKYKPPLIKECGVEIDFEDISNNIIKKGNGKPISINIVDEELWVYDAESDKLVAKLKLEEIKGYPRLNIEFP